MFEGAVISFDMQESDTTWLLFSPRGILWACSPTPFALAASAPLNGALRVAIANSCTAGVGAHHCRSRSSGWNAAAYKELLTRYAGSYPTNATVDLTVEGDVGVTSWRWGVQTMRGWPTGSLLQLAWPVHLPLLLAPVRQAAAMNAATPFQDIRGTATAIVGSSWRLRYNLMPDVGLRAPRPIPQEWRQDLLQALRGTTGALWNGSMPDRDFDLPLNYQLGVGDTYFSGKLLGRLARLIVVADELGESQDPYFRDMVVRLEHRMEVWLKRDAATPFVYDSSWGGLLSCGCLFDDCGGKCTPHCSNTIDPPENCPALSNAGMNFGNSIYNDHHFHYGYFVYAAAVLAKFSPSWERQWRQQVLGIVRDYANPSWADSSFPVARHKDWFLGSSWAGGILATVNGRNQESTSESLNAYYAVYAYGHAVDAPFANDLRDFGRLLTAMEMHAADTYWHVRKHSKIYGEDYGHQVVGILWEHAATHQTWFGGAPYVVSGIQLLPFSPVMEWFVKPDWAKLDLPIYQAQCAADPECKKGWSWPVCLEQAVLDTTGAYACLQALPKDAFAPSNAAAGGNSLTNSLHWLATRPQAQPPPAVAGRPLLPDSGRMPQHQRNREDGVRLVEEAADALIDATTVLSAKPGNARGQSHAGQHQVAVIPTNTAHPKVQVVPATPDADPAAYCYMADTSYHPLDMPGQVPTTGGDAQSCQKKCARIEGCAHFSLLPDGSCHFQASYASSVPHPRATAGPAHCAPFRPNAMVASEDQQPPAAAPVPDPVVQSESPVDGHQQPPVQGICTVGQEVGCPGDSDVRCSGNQCCPDGSACPSAETSFSGCVKGKVKDCLAGSEEADYIIRRNSDHHKSVLRGRRANQLSSLAKASAGALLACIATVSLAHLATRSSSNSNATARWRRPPDQNHPCFVDDDGSYEPVPPQSARVAGGMVMPPL